MTGFVDPDAPSGSGFNDPDAAPKKAAAQKPAGLGALDTSMSWINEAIAGIPDALLNTPTNLMNLGIAAYGAGTGKGGDAPNPIANPDIVKGIFKRGGLINDAAEPTSIEGRITKAALQSGIMAPLAPAQSMRQAATNIGLGTISGLAGQGTAEVTDSPAAGITASMLVNPAAGTLYNARQNNVARQNSLNQVRDQTWDVASHEGYVLPPSAVNPTFLGNRVEGIAGKAALRQDAEIRNQQVTNRLAKRSLGMAEDTPLTEQRLEQYRNQVSQPYRDVGGLSRQAHADLEALRDARFEANAQWRFFDRSGDPAAMREARRQDQLAHQLEMALETAAVQAGRPQLLPQLREARTQIARSYDVERALNLGDGNVSAQIIGRSMDRGRPLTGDLQTIGRFAEAFPQFSREAARVPTPGVSKIEALSSLGFGLGGYAALGPMGTALAAAPFAAGPTRALLLSRPAQGLLARPSVPGAQVSDPFLRGILSGAAQAEQ